MKIAFFVNNFPHISETFILNQIVGSIRRGHEVCIYTRNGTAAFKGKQHADVGRHRLLDRTRSFPMPGPWLPRLESAAKRLARWGVSNPKIAMDSLNALRHGRSALNLTLVHELLPPHTVSERYDVIHCHFGPNGNRAASWRDFKALRGPIITTFHGYDVNRLPGLWGENLYEKLFNDGELFTVGSEFMKRRVIALGAPEDRVAKLPMGVDLSLYRFNERIESGNGRLQLLTVARLVEVKGIEYAIRAVAALNIKYPHLHYRIVGDGPLRTELEEMATRLGIADQVEFLGALTQEEVVELYSAAQIFLLPSVVTESGEEEGQSLALAEAQATGLPVIGTSIGGVSESMREGESGLLIPPGDANALARAIGQLAEHPQVWGRMGRIGRAHVERNFSLERLNDQLVDLYRMVAAEQL